MAYSSSEAFLVFGHRWREENILYHGTTLRSKWSTTCTSSFLEKPVALTKMKKVRLLNISTNILKESATLALLNLVFVDPFVEFLR